MWAAALVLFALVVASTLSRGPWAGLAVASLIVLVCAVRIRVIEPRRTWLYGAVAAGVILAVFAVAKFDRTTRTVILLTARVYQLAHLETDPSVMNRFVYFDAARRMLRDHPIAGVGFESYGLLYPRYRPVEGDVIPSDVIPTMVHNGYLQMAVTNGLPAPVLYLVLMASILWLLVRTSRALVVAHRGGAARDPLIGAAFIGAIVGYLVQDLSGWQEISLSAFFWPLLGAAVSFCTVTETDSRRVTTRPSVRQALRRSSQPAAARLAVSIAAASFVVAAAFLATATYREMSADALCFETIGLDPSRDWPRIEQNLEASLQLARNDPYYLDAAGLQYLKRLQVTGQRQVHDKAAALFSDAAQRDRFNPYPLIHRIDVETAGLMQGAISSPGTDVEDVVAKVLEMDSNNATVHESIAQLRLAENRPQDALVSIQAAESLRPGHPRYHMLEGDTLRLLGHKADSIEAYRREAAILKDSGAPDWVTAENKLVMSLIESGQHQFAASEAEQVIARVPSYSRSSSGSRNRGKFTRGVRSVPGRDPSSVREIPSPEGEGSPSQYEIPQRPSTERK